MGDEELGGARSVIHDYPMRRYLGALLLATGLMLGPLGMACALADQDDPRLDDLFTRLKATDDLAEVQQLNDQIWFIWLDSGREEIDALMLEGRRFVERRRPRSRDTGPWASFARIPPVPARLDLRFVIRDDFLASPVSLREADQRDLRPDVLAGLTVRPLQ